MRIYSKILKVKLCYKLFQRLMTTFESSFLNVMFRETPCAHIKKIYLEALKEVEVQNLNCIVSERDRTVGVPEHPAQPLPALSSCSDLAWIDGYLNQKDILVL